MITYWLALQELAVYVLFWPLITIGAFAAGAALLLALAELLMYASYRVLTRLGIWE